MPKGYVYLISFEDPVLRKLNPYVKIGISYDKDKRLSQIQTGSPLQLKFFGLIISNEPRTIEKYLHKLLAKDRVVGEWFCISKGLIDAIRTRYEVQSDISDELISSIEETPETIKIRELENTVKILRKELIARENYLKEFKKDYEVCRMWADVWARSDANKQLQEQLATQDKVLKRLKSETCMRG